MSKKIVEQWLNENYYHESVSLINVYDDNTATQYIYDEHTGDLTHRVDLTTKGHTLEHVYMALHRLEEGYIGLKSKLLRKDAGIDVFRLIYSKKEPIAKQKIWRAINYDFKG